MIFSNEGLRALDAVYEGRGEDNLPGMQEVVSARLVELTKDGYEITADGREVHQFAAKLRARSRTDREPR